MVEKVIILGSGPAGLSAAIYTSREGFSPLVIAGFNPGGQLLLTTTVENFPGFPDGVYGPDLITQMRAQAQKFGTRFIDTNATSVDFGKRPFKVTADDKTYEAESVIIATGANAKWLGIPSEQKFIGHGVSNCATCLPPTSLIVANASTMQIGAVNEANRVLTHDGTFREVKSTMSRHYTGDLVKFQTRFFRSEQTFLTPNHPVLTRKFARGKGINYKEIKWSEPSWVEAGELEKGDVVLYPIPVSISKLKHIHIGRELGLEVDSNGCVKNNQETYTSHRIPNKIRIDEDFGLLVGYYLSEGFSHDRGISFAFSSEEMDYAKEVKRLINKIFGIDSTIRKENNVLRVTAHSLTLSKLFKKLFGSYSHEKKLPHEFILMNKGIQKEIIKGLWRGDGSERKKDFIITSSSRELVEQTKMMLLRLNILPGVEKRKFETLRYSTIEGRKVEFKKDVYQLVVGGPWLESMGSILGIKHPMSTKRKWNSYHGWLKDGYALLKIKEISKKHYDGEVHNIAVAGNNTYVTTNSIVHNCDGPFYKGKDVIAVGGGDTAMEDSLFLTRFANSVTVVHRKDTFRASKIMQERAKANPKIKTILNTVVQEVKGEKFVTSVVLNNVVTKETTEMKTDGVFVAIGYTPNTDIFKGQINLDEKGYILPAKEEIFTNVEGVFVAGDVADHVFRQAATASGSGVKAAIAVREYLANLEESAKK